MERDQASKFINDLLKLMVGRNGSDLFFTPDFPPAIKVDDKVTKVSPQPLSPNHTLTLARAIMSGKQVADFERSKECNFAMSPAGLGRFRANAVIQQGHVGTRGFGIWRNVRPCRLPGTNHPTKLPAEFWRWLADEPTTSLRCLLEFRLTESWE